MDVLSFSDYADVILINVTNCTFSSCSGFNVSRREPGQISTQSNPPYACGRVSSESDIYCKDLQPNQPLRPKRAVSLSPSVLAIGRPMEVLAGARGGICGLINSGVGKGMTQRNDKRMVNT